MAERYSYLAYLGLFLILSYLLVNKLKVFSETKGLPVLALSIYLLFLSGYTYARVGVWENSYTLWTDVIEKYPNHFLAYANRAAYYIGINRFEEAIADFDECIAVSPENPACSNSKGLLLRRMDRFQEALNNFNYSLSIDSNYFPALMNRGMLQSYLNR